MTDRDGNLVQHYGYYPFGSERYENNQQAFSVSNRYTGQILDEDTGLYYYGARYYDPELGRFINLAHRKIRQQKHICYCSQPSLSLTLPL